MIRTLLTMSLVSLALPSFAAAPSTCDRDCLVKFADDFLDAMVRHDPNGLAVANAIKAAENQMPMKLGEGAWRGVTSFARTKQYVVDTETGQVGVQAILYQDELPAVFALRLKVVNGQITEAETLLAHDGEGGTPFLPQGFLIREAPYVRDVPLAVRSSRTELLQTAETYWDLATSTHKGEAAPYTVDCFHYQNGMNTDWEASLKPGQAPFGNTPAQAYDGRIWTCARELTLTTEPWTRARDARTLVDVERGLVMTWNLVDQKGRPGPDGKTPPPPGPFDSINVIPLPGISARGYALRAQPQTLYHAEVMRIIGGKIQREQVFQRVLAPNAKSAF